VEGIANLVTVLCIINFIQALALLVVLVKVLTWPR